MAGIQSQYFHTELYIQEQEIFIYLNSERSIKGNILSSNYSWDTVGNFIFTSMCIDNLKDTDAYKNIKNEEQSKSLTTEARLD